MSRFAILLRRAAAALGLAALSTAAAAHQASDAYLRASTDADGRLALQVEVALRDLDIELALDGDADGRLLWGELRPRRDEIAAHVAAHLSVDDGRCALQPAGFALDRKADGVYAVLAYRSDCVAAAAPVLGYGLFGGSDPTHRGLLLVAGADGAPTAPPVSLAAGGRTALAFADAADGDAPLGSGPAGFFADGLHHILIGADHVLFLVCLILPLALGRGRTEPPRGRALWWPVLTLVTAFTVAHSLTLGLAAWRLLAVPPSVIEPLIALTIAVAALDNLRPLLGERRVAAAFVFGLIHGFGFAGPLTELDLPPAAMAWALLQFNLGVEVGQLLVVGLALALLWPLRERRAPARWALQGGSLAVGLLALVWLGERVLDFKVLPI